MTLPFSQHAASKCRAVDPGECLKAILHRPLGLRQAAPWNCTRDFPDLIAGDLAIPEDFDNTNGGSLRERKDWEKNCKERQDRPHEEWTRAART